MAARTIPVAMAPLAQSNADNIAAWTLRSTPLLVFGQGNNSSSEATVEKRGSSKNLSLCRSTDRIRVYETCDGGSIPSRDAKISHSLILD